MQSRKSHSLVNAYVSQYGRRFEPSAASYLRYHCAFRAVPLGHSASLQVVRHEMLSRAACSAARKADIARINAVRPGKAAAALRSGDPVDRMLLQLYADPWQGLRRADSHSDPRFGLAVAELS